MFIVTIERQEDGGVLIIDCDKDFQSVLNGDYPDDNFDNTEVIPKEPGRYIFDVSLRGGEEFNGEHTEYWSESLLLNCRQQPIDNGDMIGKSFFRNVTYKITMTKCNNIHLLTNETRDDFIDWLLSKSVELGIGKFHEYYYDHDESGNTYVEVEFNVQLGN